MLTIGLCGGSGTGKNTAAEAFLSAGIPVIDADAVYHGLVGSSSPLTEALAARFGKEILTEGGALDRVALRRVVFSGGAEAEAARADLNRLTHGEVLAVFRQWLSEQKEQGADLAVVNAPLLIESGFDKECDLVAAVLADRDLRIERLCKRDGLTATEAASRIDAQLSDATLSEHADHIFYNNGTEAELHDAVHQWIPYLKTVAEEKTHGK